MQSFLDNRFNLGLTSSITFLLLVDPLLQRRQERCNHVQFVGAHGTLVSVGVLLMRDDAVVLSLVGV